MNPDERPELEPREAPAEPPEAPSLPAEAEEAPLAAGPSPEGEGEEAQFESVPAPEAPAPRDNPPGETKAEARAEDRAGRRRDSLFAEGSRLPLVAAAVFLLVLLIGAAALWRTRSELAATRSELTALRESARRSELLHARSGIVRARADLEGVKESLPPELAAEVQRADALLAGVANRLKASP